MRLFAILLVLLTAGLGWALWQGIDLAASQLAEATAEEPDPPVLDGLERSAVEQGSDSREITQEPEPQETGAAMSGPEQEPAAEASAEGAARPPEQSTRSAEPPAGSVVTANQPAASDEVAPVITPTPDARSVTGDQVNLRKGPDADTPSLGLLALDDTVEVLEEDGDWTRVRTEEGEEGWVAAQFLVPSQG